MYSVSEIKKGLKVEIDNQPYTVIDFQFVKPGKGQAFTRTKLKNLITGTNLERTFKIVESLAEADISNLAMQFLYKDGDGYHFMNLESFDQIALTDENVGESRNWLIPDMQVEILFWNARAIALDLPTFVDLEITYCEPGTRGNTATGTNKPATLSTGAIVGVPLFVNQGEWVRIDTRTGEYHERVKK
jgi:elongation factor P